MDTIAAVQEIEHMIGILEPVQQAELDILFRGGVTPADVQAAIHTWGRAHHVAEDWGYLRTVMLRRAAERELLRREVTSS